MAGAAMSSATHLCARWPTAAITAVLGVPVGCGADVLVDESSGSATGAAGSNSGGSSGGTAAGGAGGFGTGGRGEVCPRLPGPTMVPVDAYCIDSTEVTNDHYAAFLPQAPPVESQPPFCFDGMWFNLTFTPADGWPAPPEKADHPVVWVDWWS